MSKTYHLGSHPEGGGRVSEVNEKPTQRGPMGGLDGKPRFYDASMAPRVDAPTQYPSCGYTDAGLHGAHNHVIGATLFPPKCRWEGHIFFFFFPDLVKRIGERARLRRGGVARHGN